LNRRPVLKSFLKDAGEADGYENVTVTFIPGRPAILTIYDDNDNENEKEVERVELFDYDKKDKEALHELLRSKGFRRRSEPKSREVVIHLDPHHHDDTEAGREKRQEQLLVERELVKKNIHQQQHDAGTTTFTSTSTIRYLSWAGLVSLLILFQGAARRRLWKRPQQME
jgi:hypothetical protein